MYNQLHNYLINHMYYIFLNLVYNIHKISYVLFSNHYHKKCIHSHNHIDIVIYSYYFYHFLIFSIPSIYHIYFQLDQDIFPIYTLLCCKIVLYSTTIFIIKDEVLFIFIHSHLYHPYPNSPFKTLQFYKTSSTMPYSTALSE